MIKVDEVNVMSIQLQNEDVDMFVQLISKLVVETRKPGFKKLLDKIETDFLYQIAESVGINVKVDDVNIHAEQALVKDR